MMKLRLQGEMKYGQMEGVRKIGKAGLYYCLLRDVIPSCLVSIAFSSFLSFRRLKPHPMAHSFTQHTFRLSFHLFISHPLISLTIIFGSILFFLDFSSLSLSLLSVQARWKETPSSFMEVLQPVALLRVTGLRSL